jgi:hypothetical protein
VSLIQIDEFERSNDRPSIIPFATDYIVWRTKTTNSSTWTLEVTTTGPTRRWAWGARQIHDSLVNRITVGNCGLGFETARAILQSDDGWHVVIAGRSRQRCEEAASCLSQQAGSSSTQPMFLDLASLAAVRQFTLEFSAGDRPPLRALVCNAGVQRSLFDRLTGNPTSRIF